MIPPVHIQTAPLDAGVLREAARNPESGAVVVFEGCARNCHDGKPVAELSYEAYEPMAIAQLEVIRAEAIDRFSLHSCLIHHRLGTVPLTEASVIVVCASSHRSESLLAMAWLLDELKECVPIWKREHYQDHHTAWIEAGNIVDSE